jgi:hypothetical protein
MAVNKNSNENQTAATPFRFAEFELHPQERLLKQHGRSVSLAPKAFDALLCLVSQAGGLVRKKDLLDSLWPETHVSEASLTNVIVGLRKLLGHEAIQTVSKHGYRFLLPVLGEPGIGRETYERFVRAKELIQQRSLHPITSGRELLWVCLSEDPSFAPAWVWMGRASWLLGKLKQVSTHDVDLARAAFHRAFLLDPELPAAHQFYTPMEADMGRARQALQRLENRVHRFPGEPESWAGLVQAFRFGGLLEKSVDADARARELDPAIVTSIPHTHFLCGDFATTIAGYGGRPGFYLDAAAWAALGETRRAAQLLRERMERTPPSPLMGSLMGSLRALLEDRHEVACEMLRTLKIENEPEALVYIARHESHAGLGTEAIARLQQAAVAGFLAAPQTLESDPWLETVRRHPEFPALLDEHKQQAAYNANLSLA